MKWTVIGLGLTGAQAAEVKTIWAKRGDPVVIECTRQGEMIRFEEPKQVLAIKFRNTEATYLAPQKSVWRLDPRENSARRHALILRIDEMNADSATSLSCVDEMGSQLDYRIRLFEEPQVSVTVNRDTVLNEGDLLEITCEAQGGAPPPQLSWSNSIGDANFAVSQGNALAKPPSSVKSRVTYTVDADFHNQFFSCNVQQANTTTPAESERVYVQYKPRDVTLELNNEVTERTLLESPSCTARSYPASRISYQISSEQKEWREFKPSATPLTMGENGQYVRCVAANALGTVFSDSRVIKVFRQATSVKMARPTPSGSTTSTTSTVNARMVNREIVDDQPAQQQNLATQVEKSGKNGIILSIIGSGAFLLVVLFGIVLRRFVRRGQGQTYKTDELSELDEGISLHDPELEAHKKKEYFM